MLTMQRLSASSIQNALEELSTMSSEQLVTIESHLFVSGYARALIKHAFSQTAQVPGVSLQVDSTQLHNQENFNFIYSGSVSAAHELLFYIQHLLAQTVEESKSSLRFCRR